MTPLPDIIVGSQVIRVEGKRRCLVESQTNPDEWYVVEADSKGEYMCSCPAQVYHPDRDCKHLASVKRWLMGVEEAHLAEPLEEAVEKVRPRLRAPVKVRA